MVHQKMHHNVNYQLANYQKYLLFQSRKEYQTRLYLKQIVQCMSLSIIMYTTSTFVLVVYKA